MSMAIVAAGEVMGRLRAAIEAGRQAVATQHDREVQARAILAIGLREGALVTLALQRSGAAAGRRGPTILIADRLPTELVSAPDLVFEHLPPLAELLVAAPPPVAAGHRLRRLFLILRRWQVAECLWHGAEAADLVQLARASTGPDRPPCQFGPAESGPSNADRPR